MPRWWFLLGVAGLACGSDVVVDATSSSGTTGAGGGSSVATVATTSSGAGGSATTTTTSSSGGAGGALPVEQGACFWPGGLDHIVVMQRDAAQGVCIRLFADWPTAPGQLMVQANNDWGVNQIVLSTDLADCLDPMVAMGADGTPADAAAGTMTVPMSPPYPPPTVDLSVQATFSGLPPGILPTHTINATALPMGNCF